MAVDLRKIYGEPYVYVGLLSVVIFLWITFDPVLAGIYFGMIVADFFIWQAFKPKINFNSVSHNSFSALIFALVAFGIVGVLSIGVTFFFNNVHLFGVNAVGGFTQFLANNMLGASVNPLKDNPIMIFIIWGILIPIIETRLVARMLEFFANVTSTSLSLKDFRAWVVFFVIAGAATWFHLSAKGLTNNTALVVTFIFFLVTCAMIAYFKEMESAVYLHIVNNSAAVWTVLKDVGRWFV